jgi:hypothetical protein
MKTETNPNSEFRSPKEIRIPKPKTPSSTVGKYFPALASQSFQNSGFGLLSAFGIRHSAFTIP